MLVEIRLVIIAIDDIKEVWRDDGCVETYKTHILPIFIETSNMSTHPINFQFSIFFNNKIKIK